VVGLLVVIFITIIVVRRSRMRQLTLDDPDPYPNDVQPMQSPFIPTSPSRGEKEGLSHQAIEDLIVTRVRDSMARRYDLELGGSITSDRLRAVDEQSQSTTVEREAELAGVIIRALKTFRRRDDDNGAAPPAYAGEE
jgi:hypothetical protein